MARRRRKESRPRRQRTTFSAHQTLRLELEYARGEYVARARRSGVFLSHLRIIVLYNNMKEIIIKCNTVELTSTITNVGRGLFIHLIRTI